MKLCQLIIIDRIIDMKFCQLIMMCSWINKLILRNYSVYILVWINMRIYRLAVFTLKIELLVTIITYQLKNYQLKYLLVVINKKSYLLIDCQLVVFKLSQLLNYQSNYLIVANTVTNYQLASFQLIEIRIFQLTKYQKNYQLVVIDTKNI